MKKTVILEEGRVSAETRKDYQDRTVLEIRLAATDQMSTESRVALYDDEIDDLYKVLDFIREDSAL